MNQISTLQNHHLKTLDVNGKTYHYARLKDLDALGDWKQLPMSLKILLENLLRHYDNKTVTTHDLQAVIHKPKAQQSLHEIGFRPARVLMQDFTGVPAIVDLAAMRDAMQKRKNDASKINPLIPVDLVIDHSVMVDHFATSNALSINVALEFARNEERYAFLKWGTKTFKNFRVVPPGTGICHQVNLEYLAKVVWQNEINGITMLYPDTVVGTDSHTTMVNGLAVLGWGVGGIEAEAAMLGQPISMLIPNVLGVRLTGALPPGCTATDLVLTVTQILRKKGVVGHFVEYFGTGLETLTLADRATIANMAPEYGATCGFFGIDQETLNYLRLTGRSEEHIQLVEVYAKEQGLWHHHDIELAYNDIVEIDLSTIEPSVAGPKRPQDRVALKDLKNVTENITPLTPSFSTTAHQIDHHDVVLAAITSCTNTSNPAVLIAAGLLARKARHYGLSTKPWVKTSFAPGSQVVMDYLIKANLMDDLESLGFHIVGFGCTTCIGNSGPLHPKIIDAIEKDNLTVAGVLSGNRNFEGRINPHVKANYLASPPLVVAFALAGTTCINLQTQSLGTDTSGNPVYLKDIWPSQQEIQEIINTIVTPDLFINRYHDVFEGDKHWKAIQPVSSETYTWNDNSTYIKNPPYFRDSENNSLPVGNIKNARILALLGDSITTDHISPAGTIKLTSPAGLYLENLSVKASDFNSYGARRGNHEIMMRGTFANIRLQNEQVPEKTGGYTRYYDDMKSQEPLAIFDAALRYMENKRPLVIIAGKEYGTGSSRDWAAKGTRLLGITAVIAESFERIHRSNLVGMGVLPLVFEQGTTRKTLELKGDELIDIIGFDDHQTLTPGMHLKMVITRSNGTKTETNLICRVDTEDEVAYMKDGGILPYVLNSL